MGTCRRAALAGIQERGQVLGMDLQEIPKQDSGRSTHALDHGAAQSQISFLPQVDRQQLKLYVPTCLEGSAGTTSFYRPVSTTEQVWLREAVFKVRKIGGIRCVGETLEKGIKSDFVRRHEAQSDRRKQLCYGRIRTLTDLYGLLRIQGHYGMGFQLGGGREKVRGGRD